MRIPQGWTCSSRDVDSPSRLLSRRNTQRTRCSHQELVGSDTSAYSHAQIVLGHIPRHRESEASPCCSSCASWWGEYHLPQICAGPMWQGRGLHAFRGGCLPREGRMCAAGLWSTTRVAATSSSTTRTWTSLRIYRPTNRTATKKGEGAGPTRTRPEEVLHGRPRRGPSCRALHHLKVQVLFTRHLPQCDRSLSAELHERVLLQQNFGG